MLAVAFGLLCSSQKLGNSFAKRKQQSFCSHHDRSVQEDGLQRSPQLPFDKADIREPFRGILSKRRSHHVGARKAAHYAHRSNGRGEWRNVPHVHLLQFLLLCWTGTNTKIVLHGLPRASSCFNSDGVCGVSSSYDLVQKRQRWKERVVKLAQRFALRHKTEAVDVGRVLHDHPWASRIHGWVRNVHSWCGVIRKHKGLHFPFTQHGFWAKPVFATAPRHLLPHAHHASLGKALPVFDQHRHCTRRKHPALCTVHAKQSAMVLNHVFVLDDLRNKAVHERSERVVSLHKLNVHHPAFGVALHVNGAALTRLERGRPRGVEGRRGNAPCALGICPIPHCS